jgi:hypothetical protein
VVPSFICACFILFVVLIVLLFCVKFFAAFWSNDMSSIDQMTCPLLIKWHVLYWSNAMSSIDQMTCPLLIKWHVLYWSNDMSSIDQMPCPNRGHGIHLSYFSGVKPVIQPIRAKNIYKSSPF